MFGELKHHAYLIVGPAETVMVELKKGLIETEIIHQSLSSFGIGESRELREKQARLVSEDQERAFIIQFDSITIEAQQALLKTLEEPALRTRFFLVAPTKQMFLPTLLSRLQIIVLDPKELFSAESLAKAENFLAANPEERLVTVQKLLDASETPAATRTLALKLVQDLEIVLERNLVADAGGNKIVSALRDLELARDYLNDRAASTRLILEHLATVL
jgi:hypothetical protein